MVRFKRDAGFTLIELLIAMVVLAIILIPVSTLLLDSFQNIVTAGNKNQTLFAIQEELEKKLNSGTAGEVYDISINFPGADPMEINGRVVTIEKNYKRKNEEVTANMKAFLP
ncbi:MAG TPA: type II secretion system protein [Firmicutes bacterium]|nr:type II secretion system protein [Bacillota bacterium]